MYVIKKMQLNKFEPKPIISNRALFAAVGEKPSTITSKDTADCAGDPVPYGASKTKILGLGADMAAAAEAKHNSDGKSADLKSENPRDK